MIVIWTAVSVTGNMIINSDSIISLLLDTVLHLCLIDNHRDVLIIGLNFSC